MHASVRLATLLLIAAAPVCASAQGWFAGGSAGIAQQDDYSIGGPVTNSDDSDAAFRIFGGYMISPLQGFVVAYVDLGEAFYSGPAFGGFSERLSADGYDVSYTLGWTPGEQERIRIFGTVGLFSFDQDSVYTELGTTYRSKDNGTGFTYGVGAEFNLSADGGNAWGFHVKYQLFKDVGDEFFTGHENDRQMVMAGASYRFGRD